MSKTADLRKLIVTQLNAIPNTGRVFYLTAPKNETYPYITFELNRVSLQYSNRDDYDLAVRLWDKGNNTKRADEIADAVDAAFSSENIGRVINQPDTTILPTFFLESRTTVQNTTDRNLFCVEMGFSVQSYKKE